MDERGTSRAQLIDAIEKNARALVEVLRRANGAHWRRHRGSARTVADDVQELITRLAEWQHAVEVGAASPPAQWRTPSAAPYPAALPDRLAVVAYELLESLRAAPAQWRVWYDDELVDVDVLAATALAELMERSA